MDRSKRKVIKTEPTVRSVKPIIANGFVVADGVKICRIRGSLLEFFDKDRRRSSVRGTNKVMVNIDELAKLDKKIVMY